MSGTLILVESPNKAKKIAQLLGRGFQVRATIGHICDLPAKDYGIDLDTFAERYELRNPKLVTELRALAKRHTTVLLATDPDREGEAIAWHVARELGLPTAAPNRIEFNQITASAVQSAVASPAPINMGKVDAARSRRVLDRVVGFDVSTEICWPAGAQSAGRVQTPALHILCERERRILEFSPRTYFTLIAEYDQGFSAFVPDEDPLAEALPDDEEAGTGKRARPREFAARADADAVLAAARPHPHVLRHVGQERVVRKPEPPYTTSTLLQDSARKLRLSAGQAAAQAQSLFEAGYITYHRTDSTRLSQEAVLMARAYIEAHHPDALPAAPPKRRTQAGAQDAHEAIRPTTLDDDGAPPPAAAAMYAMIRARFLASQSRPAVFQRTTLTIAAGPVPWVAEGSVLTEPGYLVFWRPYARQSDELLPQVTVGDSLDVTDYTVHEKQTSPPARFDTGSLIKKLESSGVGRPSTYPSIVQTLLDRGYAQEITGQKGKSLLQPTEFGLRVDGLLATSFPGLVSEGYTADMEASLDKIEHGDSLDRLAYLQAWYADFRAQMADAVPRGEAYRKQHGLAPRARGGEETTITCDRCAEATYRKLARKKGRGSFLACPSCGMTRNIRAQIRAAACKQCGSALIEKRGGSGSRFFGCVRYGADKDPCGYTEREDGTPGGRYRRTPYAKSCPRCLQATLVIIEPRDPALGDAFYACDSPSCPFTLPVGSRIRGAPCPECGHAVLERRRRLSPEQKARGETGTPFWSCARYPDCKHTQPFAESAAQPPPAASLPRGAA